MKKILLVTLPLVVIAALAGFAWKLSRDHRSVERAYLETKASEDSLRVRFDLALTSIAEIQDSLAAVLPDESGVLRMSQDVEQSGALTESRRDQMLRSISDLNTSIQRSKDMISRLEQRLMDSDTKIAALERVIANLKKTVADREAMIAQLNGRVESLSVQVAGLRNEVTEGNLRIEAQRQLLENRRQEISTVYYMVSTKDRLKELGIVREAGGVLGIGRSTKLSGTFPEQYFRRVDTDLQATIPVPGRDPVVLSGQSAVSYQVVPVGADASELRITHPDEFRKVRYLVIQVD